MQANGPDGGAASHSQFHSADWSTDMTYVPMQGGFLYLAAVMDWLSRFVLSWELSTRRFRGSRSAQGRQAREGQWAGLR